MTFDPRPFCTCVLSHDAARNASGPNHLALCASHAAARVWPRVADLLAQARREALLSAAALVDASEAMFSKDKEKLSCAIRKLAGET